MYKILSRRFRSRCLEDILQPDFARHFKVSNVTASAWINKPEKLSLERFLAICDLINAEPTEFITKEK